MNQQTKQRWLTIWTDIFALNSFSYLVSAPIELIIAGMSWQEHLQVRLVAAILNTLVAVPFGWWRAFIVRLTNLNVRDSFIKVYLVDTLIFLSFQLPLYVGNLVLGGAEMSEILAATITITLIAGLLGRPYGIYLDWLKVKHGLKHTLKPAVV
ncbi:L-alanine exporter AlaE [Aliikangiella sp. IMCC44653]